MQPPPDMFDWVSPELRQQIDLIYEPEFPPRILRQSAPDELDVNQLVYPGNWIRFEWQEGATKDTRRSLALGEVHVAQVIRMRYMRAERHAVCAGIRFPDGADRIHGWTIYYQIPYKQAEIDRLHRKGHRLEARTGQPKNKQWQSIPVVAVGGRILAMTHHCELPDDCEVIVTRRNENIQLDVWESQAFANSKPRKDNE